LGTDTVTEAVSTDLDTLDFSDTTSLPVNINLSIGGPQFINSNLTLSLSAGNVVENVNGGAGNDQIIGNARNNVLTARPGNDRINGPHGHDTLLRNPSN